MKILLIVPLILGVATAHPLRDDEQLIANPASTSLSVAPDAVAEVSMAKKREIPSPQAFPALPTAEAPPKKKKKKRKVVKSETPGKSALDSVQANADSTQADKDKRSSDNSPATQVMPNVATPMESNVPASLNAPSDPTQVAKEKRASDSSAAPVGLNAATPVASDTVSPAANIEADPTQIAKEKRASDTAETPVKTNCASDNPQSSTCSTAIPTNSDAAKGVDVNKREEKKNPDTIPQEIANVDATADKNVKKREDLSPRGEELIEKIYKEEKSMKKIMAKIVKEEKKMEKMLEKLEALEERAIEGLEENRGHYSRRRYRD